MTGVRRLHRPRPLLLTGAAMRFRLLFQKDSTGLCLCGRGRLLQLKFEKEPICLFRLFSFDPICLFFVSIFGWSSGGHRAPGNAELSAEQAAIAGTSSGIKSGPAFRGL
jgi:hypothetical protein